MAYIPPLGSVAAWLQSDNASVITRWQDSSILSVPVGSTITVQQGSVATVIIGGSIAASFTPPANQSVSGTVQANVIASVATVIIGGSIATATTNSSVVLLNGTNVIGSVAALQSTNPWIMTGSVQGTVSVIGTVPVTQSTSPWIITGSIQGGGAGTQYIENAITPSVTGNAIMFKSNTSSSIVSVVTPSTPLPVIGSVSGTVNLGVGTALIGSVILGGGVNAIGSVATLQGTNPWITANTQTGTVITSIAGILENTIQASTTGVPIFFKSNLSTSVLSVVSPATPLPVSVQGTVTALQGTTPWVIGSVYGNISGSVAATITNTPAVTLGNASVISVGQGSIAVAIVSGSVAVATGNSSVQLLAGTTMIGSVATYAQSSGGSVITVGQGSVATVIIGGSIAASFTPPANQSVSGTVQTDVKASVAVVIIGGSVATATTNSSVMLLNSTNVIGSVMMLQGTNPFIITGSIQGGGAGTQYAENAITTSVTGTAVMFRSNANTSIMSVVDPRTPLPVSGSVSGTVNLGLGTTTIGSVVLSGGVNAIGSVATLQGTVPWIISSVYGNISGSVVAFQGGAPWTQTFSNSSILAVPVGSTITVFQNASLLAVQSGTWNVSVVGNMAGTSSVYQVLSSISTISVMAANINRKAGTIYNTAATTLFIKLGTAANTSVYTVLMNPNDYYELPGGWTGVVAGITNSTAGTINVTELS